MNQPISEDANQQEPGRPRPGSSSLRQTGSWVRFWDRVAGIAITGGGLTVLAAMLGICVFLIASAAPLFQSGGVEETRSASTSAENASVPFMRLSVRPGTVLIMGEDGYLVEVSLKSGVALARLDLTSEGVAPSALSYDAQAELLTLAYSDGTVRSGTLEQADILLNVEFARRYWADLAVGSAQLLDEAQRSEVERALRLRDGLSEQARVERTADEQWVIEDLRVSLLDPVSIPGVEGTPEFIHSVRATPRLGRLVVLTDAGRLYYAESRRTVSLGGRGSRETVRATEIDLGEQISEPMGVFVTRDGVSVLLAHSDGLLRRFDSGEGVSGSIEQVESLRLVDGTQRVTSVRFALGGLSLLVGDSSGRVSGWTIINDELGGGEDGRRLTRSASYALGNAPVTSIGVGERDRTIAVGQEDGSVELRNMTSGKRIARLEGFGSVAPIVGVAVSPALDRVAAVRSDGSLQSAEIEPGHPQAGWTSLFGRVLYEGYDKPEYVYQSTGAQGVESKLSLTPLIWGTLKATVVAMLFAAPIAVLGAVFSSEFLHPKVRHTIKPTVELMASLPSVVLGFVAAVLVAPYVRDWLPGIMVGFVVVPLVVMGSAHAWRLAPPAWNKRLTSSRLLAMVGLVLTLSLGLSALLGPVIERTLFAPTETDRALASGLYTPVESGPAWLGERRELTSSEERRLRTDGFAVRDGALVEADTSRLEPGTTSAGEPRIRRWLDGVIGNAWPGWLVVLVIPASALVSVVSARFLSRPWAGFVARRSKREGAAMELGRFGASAVISLVLAIIGATFLTRMGFDPRDSIFGPFTQRNTLVVGLVMGFAVIPIIFTIADDAMRAVPDTLRSASLGSGATRWQTAVRVVLPVAGSGIFSACMIGLGRAVGETMIVLMATGNTPEMTLNIFSGFRTLAANIAVELPEAARGGTHYRVLFLCGLVLFAMTAIINTSAELVRQSFRKKNAAL